MMYACVLIPRELSLVLTLHPNPMHVLEMSATVWSNTHLSPGTIFYPDEGEVRIDRIESRIVISDEDIRRFYGCYDAILNINGQEVRHCNWVRFVKTTSVPNDANIISSKVRGQSFYQVVRPVKPNEEIIVLFHLTAERSMCDIIPQGPFTSFSPNRGTALAYSDLQTPLLVRHSHDAKPTLMTSTPLSTKLSNQDSFTEDTIAQRRSLKFGSSSSSSLDTPNSSRYQRGIHHESSFTSPVCTTSSSRETSTSDNYSGPTTSEASYVKGDNQINNESGTHAVADSPKNDLNNEAENCDRDDGTCHNRNDQSQDLDVDVVDEGNEDVDNSCDYFHSESSHSVDEGDDDFREESRGNKDPPNAPPEASQLETVVKESEQTIDSQTSADEEPSPLLQNPCVEEDHPELTVKTEAGQSPEIQQPSSERNTRSLHVDDSQSLAPDVADSEAYDYSMGPKGKYPRFEDVKYCETDNLSSPNEARPLSYKLPFSPKSARSLDLLDYPQLKRCRERNWWPCDVCGKKFDRPSLLKRHTRTHTGEKPHPCDVCGKAFSTSSSLNTHRRIHSGEKPHQCKTCGKRFTASSNLYYHRMTHNKEKPHKCHMCSKSFPTPGDLRSHTYIHNGSWPFRCGVCNRGFSKQTNLKNHMLLHSGDKPHKCSRCDKKFALLCNLKTHLKTHESSDSSDCTECLKCGIALGVSDDLRGSICNRCLDDSSRMTSKPSTPSLSSSLRQQRHTDFSISKLTSSDHKGTSFLSEKNYTLVTPPTILDENMKARASSGLLQATSMTPHHLQVPTMYRQFFTPPSDQWFLPAPSQHILTTQFLSATIKNPNAFHGSSIQSADGQTPPSVVTKINTANPAHSGIPAFVTPEMSLRGNPVFPLAGSLPPGFSLHHGSVTWGGHVVAQGF